METKSEWLSLYKNTQELYKDLKINFRNNNNKLKSCINLHETLYEMCDNNKWLSNEVKYKLRIVIKNIKELKLLCSTHKIEYLTTTEEKYTTFIDEIPCVKLNTKITQFYLWMLFLRKIESRIS